MRLHVHEFGPGAGRTVVAVHGVGGSGQSFRRVADRLPAFRFVCPDLRGHGASTMDPPWDLAVHLRDLRETLDGLGVSRAPFVGFSFGGRLGLELAAGDRFRVERLVLLDPIIRATPELALASATATLETLSYASVEEAIAGRVASGIAPYAAREHWDVWAEQLVRGDDGRLRLPYSRPAVITMWSEMATPPPPFEQVRIPTLLVVGDGSDRVPQSQIERYRYELGDFLEVTTVHALHNVIADATDEVAAAIGAFLTR